MSPGMAVGVRGIMMALALGLAPLLLLTAAERGNPEAAKDARQAASLMREIRSGLSDESVSDEALSEKIAALAEAPSARAVRFLAQQVLGTLEHVEQRHEIDRDALIEPAVRALWRMAEEESLRETVASWLEQLMFEERHMTQEGSHAIVALHLRHRADSLDAEFYLRALSAERWTLRVVTSHHVANEGTEVLDEAGRREVLENRWDIDYRVRTATVFVIERMILDAPPGPSEERVAAYEALVEMLEREASGLRFRITEILHGRTGEPYPDDASLWRAWLEAFRAGEVEEDPGQRVQSRMDLRRYFSVQIPNKTVFVIDTSQSMGRELVEKEAIRKRLEEEGQARDFDWDAIETRLDLARAELIHVIDALDEPDPSRSSRHLHPRNGRMPGDAELGDPTEAFTVIAYNSRVRYWRSQVVPATRENKDDAIEWIRSLEARELTNFYDAIDTALHMAAGHEFPESAQPAEPEADKRGGTRKHPPEEFGGRMGEEESVEAVIFLTDGFATTGKYWTNGPQTFPALDDKERGFLTYEQLLAQFDTEYLHEQQIKEWFEQMDPTGSGRITRERFEDNLASYHRLQMDNLIHEVTTRNILDQVRLHCIGIADHDRRLLKNLADFNDGIYVDLGE